MIYKVSFEIKTSKYKSIASELDTVVIAESYNDAAIKVQKEWGIYDAFKIGSITPVGDPVLSSKSGHELTIYNKVLK
jgi:hypothetical protein